MGIFKKFFSKKEKKEEKEVEKGLTVVEIAKEIEKKKILEEEERKKEENADSIIGFDGKYEFLSNDYKVKVQQNGIMYENPKAAITAERMIMMTNRVHAKYNGEPMKDLPPLDSSLEKITRLKFKQNKRLLERLKDTGGKYLNDTTVENELGRILMEIRKETVLNIN